MYDHTHPTPKHTRVHRVIPHYVYKPGCWNGHLVAEIVTTGHFSTKRSFQIRYVKMLEVTKAGQILSFDTQKYSLMKQIMRLDIHYVLRPKKYLTKRSKSVRYVKQVAQCATIAHLSRSMPRQPNKDTPKANSAIWLSFELIWDIMPVLFICKFRKDLTDTY